MKPFTIITLRLITATGEEAMSGPSDMTRWHGREALELTNGVVCATVLPHGGHLAAWRFANGQGPTQENTLWEAPLEHLRSRDASAYAGCKSGRRRWSEPFFGIVHRPWHSAWTDSGPQAKQMLPGALDCTAKPLSRTGPSHGLGRILRLEQQRCRWRSWA